MHISSLFSLSLILFVLCSWRPAADAAATLAVSHAKRQWSEDPIECPVPLLAHIPPFLPRYPSLLDMCSNRRGYPKNLRCQCQGQQLKNLVCGFSPREDVKAVLNYCLDLCACGGDRDDTNIISNAFTGVLNLETPRLSPPPQRPHPPTTTLVDPVNVS